MVFSAIDLWWVQLAEQPISFRFHMSNNPHGPRHLMLVSSANISAMKFPSIFDSFLQDIADPS